MTEPPGQPRATQDWNRVAFARQTDLPAEEHPRVLRRVLPAARVAASATTTAAPTTATASSTAASTELEDAGIFEEEVALLGKQQTEAREVDLLLVGLNLGEVGVDREVPRQTGADAVLHVEPDVGVTRRVGLANRARAGHAVRFHADVLAGPHSAQPFDRAGQRDALQVVDARQRRPVTVLVQPSQLSLEVDAPRLWVAFAEFERPERNPDLGV